MYQWPYYVPYTYPFTIISNPTWTGGGLTGAGGSVTNGDVGSVGITYTGSAS